MNNVNNNFTTQFNHLIRERDQFKNEAATAERERRREEQILQGHRSAQQEVADHLRVAQSEDGEGTRKLQTLKESKVRLAQQIEIDRQEIVKVTNEVKGKESDDKKQKWKFVREMESINDELDVLLTKEENEKTLKLLDTDTVNWLVETRLTALTNRSDGVEENYVEAENEKWREIKKNVEEAAGALAEAKEKAYAEEREKKELEGMLNQLRQKLIAEHGNVGQAEIDALEAKWEQEYEYDDNDPAAQGDDAMEVDGGAMRKNGEMPAPVHMDIFYDNQ